MATKEEKNQNKTISIKVTLILLLIALSVVFTGQKAGASIIDGETAIGAASVQSIENTKKGILLSWKKKPGASSYRIFRKAQESGAEWKCVKKSGRNLIAWQNKSSKLKDGTAYKYVVVAYAKRAGAVSDYAHPEKYASKAAKVFRLKPVKMTSLKASSTVSASAAWKTKKTVSGYEVQFSKDPLFLKKESFVIKSSANASITKSLKTVSKKRYARIRSFKTKDGEVFRSCWSYSPNYKKNPIMKIRYFSKNGKKMEYRKLAKQKMYGFDVFQGACARGGHSYNFLLNKKKNKAKLIKVDIATGKVAKVGKGLVKGHANSFTYNPDKDLMVCANSGSSEKYFTLVNPDTLKQSMLKKAVIPDEICGIARARVKKVLKGFTAISYNPKRKKYVARVKKNYNFVVLSSDFVVERYVSITKRIKQMKQSMLCTNDMIIDLQSADGGKFNVLVLYDWAGNYISTVRLDKKYELEDVYEHNGKLYGLAYRSYTKTIVKKVKTKKKKYKKVKRRKFMRDNYMFSAE